jgi:hypothetical protein
MRSACAISGIKEKDHIEAKPETEAEQERKNT